ncbi:MAG: hypothetical protein R8L53_05645 [Mariprofundales bacterium]
MNFPIDNITKTNTGILVRGRILRMRSGNLGTPKAWIFLELEALQNRCDTKNFRLQMKLFGNSANKYAMQLQANQRVFCEVKKFACESKQLNSRSQKFLTIYTVVTQTLTCDNDIVTAKCQTKIAKTQVKVSKAKSKPLSMFAISSGILVMLAIATTFDSSITGLITGIIVAKIVNAIDSFMTGIIAAVV